MGNHQTIVVIFWKSSNHCGQWFANHQTISDLTISVCWWISRWLITIVTWFSFVTVNNTWGSNLWSNVAGIKLVFVSRRSSVVLVSPFVWIVAEVVFVWKKNQILTPNTWAINTGHFFHTCLIQSKAYFNVQNPKFGPFLRAKEVLEGPRSRKEKIITTPSFLGKKLKWGVI